MQSSLECKDLGGEKINLGDRKIHLMLIEKLQL